MDDHKRKPLRARLAEGVAITINNALAAGLDDVSTMEAVLKAFPDLSLQEYVGGLVLHKALAGAPGYVLRRFGRLQ